MFESLSHLALQQYWWVIISLLAGFLIFLLFVQGGQTLIYSLGKTPDERTMIINSMGRKWEFTFTTLVTFGGAFFASFPLFYSTSFGGAYWVWMAILFCFIVQAISYEFRSKPNNFLGAKTYEIFLFINGSLGTFLLGVAVSTFFTGSEFIINDMNQSSWTNDWRGLDALATPLNIFLGAAILFLARTLGAIYLVSNINDKEILSRIKMQIWLNGVPFAIFFIVWLIGILIRDGYAYNSETGIVSMEQFKYLHNFLAMPMVSIIFLSGVILVLFSIIKSLFSNWTKAIWPAGIGTVLTVFALFCIAGFNGTSFYPSTADLQSSLTIENASSSKYTLTAMSYVSLIIPFVLAYIIYAWRAINNKPIDKEEINNESHVY